MEQPTKFDLATNLKTAKTLGLTIPSSLPVTPRAIRRPGAAPRAPQRDLLLGKSDGVIRRVVAVVPPVPAPLSLAIRIAASADDAEESASGGDGGGAMDAGVAGAPVLHEEYAPPAD